MAATATSWLSLQQWGLRQLDGLAARRARRMGKEPSAAHLTTGLLGEREALFHLRSLGYVVTARRWKTPRLRGDIDLIAWEGEWLCFIEVKTRSEHNPMEPAEAAIDDEKRKMLRLMAKAYVKGFPRKLREQIRVRFDVLSVYPRSVDGSQGTAAEFELLRGAFGRD